MEGNIWLLLFVMIPFLGALIASGIGRRDKYLGSYFADGVTVLEFVIFLALFLNYHAIGQRWFEWKSFCGMGMSLCLDGFRALYGLITCFLWMMSKFFSREYMAHHKNSGRYEFFTLLTQGAVLGVFLSADLFTTFIFFEIMSFTSYVWVAQEETGEALRAAETYLAIAVFGGLVMLMGLFLLYDLFGTLEMNTLRQIMADRENPLWSAPGAWGIPAGMPRGRLYGAGLCLFVGFGAKAGVFPLHVWLPKAHAAAPAPASALLSGILTKTGIFGILILSCQIFCYDGVWGTLVLTLGIITMVLGAVLALYSTNLKRTLACSSLSQIGFILTGTGMAGLLGKENGLAVRGVLLHMVNHSLIKLVLFMAAGVVFMNVHRLELNEIRGFGRKKPLLHLIFLVGALGISGVPLFNGYVSKTLLHEGIVQYREYLDKGLAEPVFYGVFGMTAIEWIFLISGGLTAAYMAKLYVCIFIERNRDVQTQALFDLRKDYMDRTSMAALGISALVMGLLGVAPSLTLDRLADLGQGFLGYGGAGFPGHYPYFSLTCLKGAVISLCIGILAYFVVVRRFMMKKDETGLTCYIDRWYGRLDLENLVYRPVILKILPFVGTFVSRAGDTLLDSMVVLLRRTLYRDSPLPHELQEGTLITHVVGAFLDHLCYMAKALGAVNKEKKPEHSHYFEHRLAQFHDIFFETAGVVGRSMSFGLFLFCVGFLLTVVYLLIII